MAKRLRLRALLAGAGVVLAMLSATTYAQEVPMVTGEHWTKSSEQAKKAYLVGIANAFQVEQAYAGTNQPSDAQSVVPRFIKGLKGQTLDTVREGLDKWYAAHPDRMQRPVMETIWFEMVTPGLK